MTNRLGMFQSYIADQVVSNTRQRYFACYNSSTYTHPGILPAWYIGMMPDIGAVHTVHTQSRLVDIYRSLCSANYASDRQLEFQVASKYVIIPHACSSRTHLGRYATSNIKFCRIVRAVQIGICIRGCRNVPASST